MPRILIIDDDDISRDVLRAILESDDHDVEEAEDGQIAIDMVRESVPDLVITDIFMPGKGGVDTIEELKVMEPELRIVAITGGAAFSSFEALEEARKHGARKALTKPFDRKEILRTVRELLQQDQVSS